MEIKNFIKSQLSGWTKAEITGVFVVFGIILFCALSYQDSVIAVISAVCGILYTIIAGKGKISCYFFGLAGSGCYSTLAFQNALWGQLILYMCYYIPMEILGIFKWKKHLKKDKSEIIKTKLTEKEVIILTLLSVIGIVITAVILFLLKDKNSVIDGITTVLSIAGMYLTVRRCIEQWIIWMIVNGLSFIMWLNIVFQGTKAYATVIMWGVYFILAVYFYMVWKKEETVGINS